MKTFRILSMLLTTIAFLSCSGNGSEEIPEPVKPEEKPKTITVSLNLGGEYISTSESPIGRSNNASRVYGINVYYKDENSTSWKHYGYGLFDNTDDMKISLITSYKYKFDCTMTEDNVNKVSYTGTSNKYYMLPYSTEYDGYGATQTAVTNEFKISTTSEKHLSQIKNGKTSVINGGLKDYPRIDRFYGELLDYTPSENTTPTIELKRTAFGVKVITDAPNDGYLTLSNSDLGTIAVVEAGGENYNVETIFTFKDVYKCWIGTVTEQEFTLTLTWKRGNGASQDFTKKITVKRNVMTTININVASTTADASLNLNIDTTPMEIENINWSIEA